MEIRHSWVKEKPKENDPGSWGEVVTLRYTRLLYSSQHDTGPWYTESWFIANQYLEWILRRPTDTPTPRLAADKVQETAIP